jgi:hypothetical protein
MREGYHERGFLRHQRLQIDFVDVGDDRTSGLCEVVTHDSIEFDSRLALGATGVVVDQIQNDAFASVQYRVTPKVIVMKPHLESAQRLGQSLSKRSSTSTTGSGKAA